MLPVPKNNEVRMHGWSVKQLTRISLVQLVRLRLRFNQPQCHGNSVLLHFKRSNAIAIHTHQLLLRTLCPLQPLPL